MYLDALGKILFKTMQLLIALEFSLSKFTSKGPLAKISQARVQGSQQMETKVGWVGGLLCKLTFL